MATPSLGSSDFLLGFCGLCGREVLTHLDFDANDEELRRCVHCDAIIRGDLQPVSAEHIEASGYAIIEARVCGNGGGCSPGGCGQGLRNPAR